MQLRFMRRSKIHRATVTSADLNDVGSIAINEDLMRRTDIISGDKVSVWNVTNGERIETDAVPGSSGAGETVVNGAAAPKLHDKDIAIIVAFTLTDEPVTPKMVSVDDRNAFLEDLADNRKG
jgi:aspartate 1-decarboxylase